MQPDIPSRSALRVALRAAAHQLWDRPLVFSDPCICRMLLPEYGEYLQRTPKRASSAALRAFLVARSRYAEDTLHHAVSLSVRQYLILGAGLDTFAHRNPYRQLRVYEVDHPATQGWKQTLLSRAGIEMGRGCTYVPLDLEQSSLETALAAADFELSAPTFVSCLGVVPYLSAQAFHSVASLVSRLPTGSALALDYRQPRAVLPPREQLELDSLSSRLAQSGEALQLFFTPEALAVALPAFSVFEDLGTAELNSRYFDDRTDDLCVRGEAARVAIAWKASDLGQS